MNFDNNLAKNGPGQPGSSCIPRYICPVFLVIFIRKGSTGSQSLYYGLRNVHRMYRTRCSGPTTGQKWISILVHRNIL